MKRRNISTSERAQRLGVFLLVAIGCMAAGAVLTLLIGFAVFAA